MGRPVSDRHHMWDMWCPRDQVTNSRSDMNSTTALSRLLCFCWISASYTIFPLLFLSIILQGTETHVSEPFYNRIDGNGKTLAIILGSDDESEPLPYMVKNLR